MAYIKEPNGIDLVVKPMVLSIEDRQLISSIIASYKETGEMPQIVQKTKASDKFKTEKPLPYVKIRKNYLSSDKTPLSIFIKKAQI